MDVPRFEQAVCHSCRRRWDRYPSDELQCPSCHSEFVEIIDPQSEEALPYPSEDPEEEDILNFAGPYRNTSSNDHNPSTRGPAQQQYDGTPVGNLLNNFMSMVGGMIGGGMVQQQTTTSNAGQRSPRGFHFEAQGPGSSRFTYHSTYNTGGIGVQRGNDEDIERLMDSFFLGPGLRPMYPRGLGGEMHSGPPMVNPLAQMLMQLFDPTAARHGDAVFTQEALDRVISELMENNQMGNAPGPASADSIAQIPKVRLTEAMIGEEGKDEGACSICMDSIRVGEEVARLWCSHWFHSSCIEPWLKEHDTCPHCRKGVEQARNEAEGHGSPGNDSDKKPPSNFRNPDGGSGPGGAGPSSSRSQGGSRNSSSQSPSHGYDQPPHMPGSFYSTSWRSAPPPPIPLASRPEMRRMSTTGIPSQHRPYIVVSGPYYSHRPSMTPRHSSHRSHSSNQETPRNERRHSHHSHHSHHNQHSHNSNHSSHRGHHSHRSESRRAPPPPPPIQNSGGFRDTLRSLWSGNGR